MVVLSHRDVLAIMTDINLALVHMYVEFSIATHAMSCTEEIPISWPFEWATKLPSYASYTILEKRNAQREKRDQNMLNLSTHAR